jgi:hypothetical protein
LLDNTEPTPALLLRERQVAAGMTGKQGYPHLDEHGYVAANKHGLAALWSASLYFVMVASRLLV